MPSYSAILEILKFSTNKPLSDSKKEMQCTYVCIYINGRKWCINKRKLWVLISRKDNQNIMFYVPNPV